KYASLHAIDLARWLRYNRVDPIEKLILITQLHLCGELGCCDPCGDKGVSKSSTLHHSKYKWNDSLVVHNRQVSFDEFQTSVRSTICKAWSIHFLLLITQCWNHHIDDEKVENV